MSLTPLAASANYQKLFTAQQSATRTVFSRSSGMSLVFSVSPFMEHDIWKPAKTVIALTAWAEENLERFENCWLKFQNGDLYEELEQLAKESKACVDQLTSAHLMLDTMAERCEELCAAVTTDITTVDYYEHVLAIFEASIYDAVPLTIAVKHLDDFFKEIENEAPVDLMTPAMIALAELDLHAALSA
jgi:hypothetical protein